MRDGRASLLRLLAGFAAFVALFAGLTAASGWLRPAPFDASIPAPQADRATLIVVDSASCSWCDRFRQDVAPAYERSHYAGLAPLKYVDISQLRTSGYRLKSRVRGTPTFVLVGKDGVEVARIPGYPGGADVFFGKVEQMLTQLPSAAAGG